MATMGPQLRCLPRCSQCAAILSVDHLTLTQDRVHLVVLMAFVTLNLLMLHQLAHDHIRQAPQTAPQQCQAANQREKPHDALRHGLNA